MKAWHFFLLLLFAFIFASNAWVTEDAYITFRSIEQFFAGVGPRWNLHERVQVFTHPLWFLALSFLRLFSPDLFLLTILLSFVCTAVTLFLIHRFTQDVFKTFFFGAILFSSRAFVDYSSSGLENSLSHLLVMLFFLQFQMMLNQDRGFGLGELLKLNFIASLLLINRHDHLFLVAPACVGAWFLGLRRQDLKLSRTPLLLAAYAPLILWSAFSLVYYGFPFPNTAYAKLNIGVSTFASIVQGLRYLAHSVVHDLVTMLVLAAGLLTALRFRSSLLTKLMGLGVLLQILYVVKVGGDFMEGRFLTSAFLVSILVLSQTEFLVTKMKPAWIILLIYNAAVPRVPVKTSLLGGNHYYVSEAGISDERGSYFQHLSLGRYIKSASRGQAFPDIPWSQEGKRAQGETILVRESIGVLGYHASRNQVIIDKLALSDPLLARVRELESWRVGHYKRILPLGYTESVRSGRNQIWDPRYRALYSRIRLITQAPLFSVSRWDAILHENLKLFRGREEQMKIDVDSTCQELSKRRDVRWSYYCPQISKNPSSKRL